MRKKWMAVAALLLLTGCGANQGVGGGEYATVNGISIPQSSVDQLVDTYKNILAAQQNLENSMGEQLIYEAILRAELDENKINITEADYKEDMDSTIAQYGGEENFKAMCEQYHVTPEQMKELFKGKTISRKHQEWWNQNHKPSDEDIQAYFNEHKDELVTVKASHILVSTEEEAKKVEERLANGEDFAAVAKEVSQDPGSASNGGSLGETAISPNQYDPAFAKATLEQKVGEIGQPVKSNFGYHIIRVDERNETLEALKDDVVKAITQSQYQEYVNELRQKADVKLKGQEDASESAASESTDASEAGADASSASEEASTSK